MVNLGRPVPVDDAQLQGMFQDVSKIIIDRLPHGPVMNYVRPAINQPADAASTMPIFELLRSSLIESILPEPTSGNVQPHPTLKRMLETALTELGADADSARAALDRCGQWGLPMSGDIYTL